MAIIIYDNFDKNEEFRNNSLTVLQLGLEATFGGGLVPNKETLNEQINKIIENIKNMYKDFLEKEKILEIKRDFNLTNLASKYKKDLIDDILFFIDNEDKFKNFDNLNYVKRIKGLDATLYSEIKIKVLQKQVSELLKKEEIRFKVYNNTDDPDLIKLAGVFNEAYKKLKK